LEPWETKEIYNTLVIFIRPDKFFPVERGILNPLLGFINEVIGFLMSFKLLLHTVVLSLIVIAPIVISVAFFTLVERKIMAAIQRRKGPNVVGVWGLLQPISDGLKLVAKEFIKAKSELFIFAPVATFFLALVGFTVKGLLVRFYNLFCNKK
jgi:hypothetical protein